MMLKEHSVCYLKNVWFTLGPILNISTINSDFSLNKLKLLLISSYGSYVEGSRDVEYGHTE